MTEDAGAGMKARLRADLLAAMKAGRKDEVRLLRALVAAIDNAGAPPAPARDPLAPPHGHAAGTAEVPRLALTGAQLQALLLAEIGEREQAAAGLARHGEAARAEALHEEVRLVRRYLPALSR
ncbi:MAG: hypothetical protein JJ865_15580 [Parvibaculum sp.]|nr:hypothetical protein [Parvibaculum sp.]